MNKRLFPFPYEGFDERNAQLAFKAKVGRISIPFNHDYTKFLVEGLGEALTYQGRTSKNKIFQILTYANVTYLEQDIEVEWDIRAIEFETAEEVANALGITAEEILWRRSASK